MLYETHHLCDNKLFLCIRNNHRVFIRNNHLVVVPDNLQCFPSAKNLTRYSVPGAYERRIAARWSILLVNLRFVKLANAGFLIIYGSTPCTMWLWARHMVRDR